MTIFNQKIRLTNNQNFSDSVVNVKIETQNLNVNSGFENWRKWQSAETKKIEKFNYRYL